jgi:catechol 2,3-dioxygenase-like lactoylglutathione lyase family enzyme
MGIDLEVYGRERARLREAYLVERPVRTPARAGGVHHIALMCADVERTILFYQGLLGFPLIEIFENRDYKGSTHLFFDIGHGNSLAFFDFPGLDLGPYAEVLGGLHHIAISVEPSVWASVRSKLDEAGVSVHIDSEISMYFSDPDGVRLELIAEGLGSLYGTPL